MLLHLGYEEDACEALERYASWNGASLPPGELVTEEEKTILFGNESENSSMVDVKKKKVSVSVFFLFFLL